MSDQGPPSSRALSALVDEAKTHLDAPCSPSADGDWSRLESRLMAVEEESRISVVERPRRSRAQIAMRGGAVILAAAAAVVLFVRKEPSAAPIVTEPLREAAAVHRYSLSSTEPVANDPSGAPGAVRINGEVVTAGYRSFTAPLIEVTGTRAVFEVARKVTWLVEQATSDGDALVRVESPVHPAGLEWNPILLHLERGVVEAEVAPVSQGEAFAVDIATEHSVVRVAVHGTHLRVARTGNHVVVDLTEGVIAIGVPPAYGVTTGTTVDAPAHVELDATDLSTLRVDHTPVAVRGAVPLPVEGLVRNARPVAAPAEVATTQAPPPNPVPIVSSKVGHPHPAAPGERDVVAAKSEVVAASRTPRETIEAAVRDCAARVARPSAVRVTVTSDLRLRVSAEGVVESAQFTPPLLPEIQSCAARAIYKTKLEAETGIVTIPLEYTY